MEEKWIRGDAESIRVNWKKRNLRNFPLSRLVKDLVRLEIGLHDCSISERIDSPEGSSLRETYSILLKRYYGEIDRRF